jgi:hypothetical protein
MQPDEPRSLSQPVVSMGPWHALIEKAVTNKVGADELNKLLDFVERLDTKRAEQAYTEALCAVQAEVPILVRDSQNGQTHSRYLSMDKLNLILHPVYTRHGFSVSFSEAPAVREGWIRTVMEVRHREGHSRTFYKELPLDGVGAKGNPNAMNPVQAVVSSGSYGARVLLAGWANLTIADADQDGSDEWDTLIAEEQDELFAAIKDKAADVDEAVPLFMAFAERVCQRPIESLSSIPRRHFAAVMDGMKKVTPKAGSPMDLRRKEGGR